MEKQSDRPLDSRQTEYVYSRIHFDPRFRECILGEVPELIFYKYAASRAEAYKLVYEIRAMAAELNAVSDDLEDFIEEYETPKWED